MKLSEFDYSLPEELIAQEPLKERAGARMLVLHREAGTWEDRLFTDLPSYLRAGDCLILNDTRVFPSRLFGRRLGTRSKPAEGTGQVEIFLVKERSPDASLWEALVRPGRKMMVGERVEIAEDLLAEVVAVGTRGLRTVRFTAAKGEVRELIRESGHMPLPPYIRRADEPDDRERYQTVFAREEGSVAAPTAGLHFTPEMLEECRVAGAQVAKVTLHVGLGTFQPLDVEEIGEVRLHAERFSVTEDAVAAIEPATRRIAVGTTAVRTLETAAQSGKLMAASGETRLFLSPGSRFHVVNALLTNFHLPKSSLLVLVSAFAGHEFTMAAYRHAVEKRYRFFSYGDCMLIL